MGYSHGTQWTEEKVLKMIKKVSEIYNRMPSRQELNKYYGNSALSVKISKSGGFRFWAEKLNLEIKDSETAKGYSYENIIAEKLKILGFKVETTTTKAPYDLVIDGLIRIDVKVASKYKTNGYEVNSFGINKEYPSSDIYICVALDFDNQIERILVFPSIYVKNKSTISIGKNSKYNKYIDNYNLINIFKTFYKKLQQV